MISINILLTVFEAWLKQKNIRSPTYCSSAPWMAWLFCWVHGTTGQFPMNFLFSLGKIKSAIFKGSVPRLIIFCTGLFSQKFYFISAAITREELEASDFHVSFHVRGPCSCCGWPIRYDYCILSPFPKVKLKDASLIWKDKDIQFRPNSFMSKANIFSQVILLPTYFVWSLKAPFTCSQIL